MRVRMDWQAFASRSGQTCHLLLSMPFNTSGDNIPPTERVRNHVSALLLRSPSKLRIGPNLTPARSSISLPSNGFIGAKPLVPPALLQLLLIGVASSVRHLERIPSKRAANVLCGPVAFAVHADELRSVRCLS